MANPNPTTEVFPQIDARLDVDGSTWNLNSITNESVVLVATTAASSTAYKIGYLAERPAELNFAASNAAPAISGFSLVTTVAAVDSATKFYVDYDRAFIIVASSVSSPVSVTYSGMGSVVRSREINNVHFGHNYLGPKSSAPTVDNEGNALAAGDQYYDTSTNKMYVRNSSNSWDDIAVSVGGNTITSTDGNNLVLTTVADGENVVINSTTGTSGNTILLPKVRATADNYVLAMTDTDTGETEWQQSLQAPTLSGVTGELNTYENSAEDGGTLTLTGTDFGTDASAIDSIKIMKSDGTNSVTATSFGTPTGTGIPSIVFNGSETNYNTFPADTTWYIQVVKSGLTSNILTSGKSFTKDPTISGVTRSGGDYSGVGFTGTGGHFGSYGGPVGGGGADANTKLLLNFDRGGGTDIEDSSNTGGDGHKVTATNAVIKASPFGDGKSAMYFDGSDQLSITNHADFQFGTGDFTIEWWAYWDAVQSNDIPISYGTHTDGNQWKVLYDATHVVFYIGAAAPLNVAHGPISAKRWYHWAIVRDSGTLTLYKDGVSIVSASNSTDMGAASSGSLMVGNNSQDFYWHGYIDEVRIVKGTAVYTSNFTVPTSRLTAIDNTKLLIHSNQSDAEDANGHLPSIIGNTSQWYPATNYKKSWYSSSWRNDTGGGYLTTAQKLQITGAFTVDGWVRIDSTHSGGAVIFDLRSTGETGQQYLSMDSSSNTLNFTNASTTGSTGSGYADNNWHHFAFVRNASGAFGIFKDGTQINVSNFYGSSATAWPSGGTMFTLGSKYDFTQQLKAHFQDWRVSSEDLTLTGKALEKQSGTLGTGTCVIQQPSAKAVVDSNTVFLTRGDAMTFTDSATSGTTHAITPTGAYHSEQHGGIPPAMTWPASGKTHGSAGCYFDGNGDVLNLNLSDDDDYDVLFTTGTWSLDTWCYMSSYPANTETTIILGGTDGSVHGYGIGYTNTTSGSTGYWGFSAVNTSFTPSTNCTDLPTLNTWFHILMVCSWSGTTLSLKIYKDGKYLGEQSQASSQVALSDFIDHAYACIGGDAHNNVGTGSGNKRNWDGYLDNFRLSGNDVTADSADPLYTNNGTNPSTNNFVSGLPTKAYGADGPENPSIGTIEITTATEDDVNVTYSFQGSTKDNAAVLGSSSDLAIASDTTGADKKKGTLTGTLQGTVGSVTNLRIQAKANDDANRLVEVNESAGVGAVSFTKVASGESVLFNARRYVGNDLARSITGFGFEPGLVWFKNRDNDTMYHNIFDSIRGGTKVIYSNHTSVQNTRSGSTDGYITSFDSDGVSITTDTSDNGLNNSGDGIIAWGWKAGGAPTGGALPSIGDGTGGTVTSGAGTIDSSELTNVTNVTQSVSRDSGFSITQYESSSDTTGTFPHNLGAVPELVIIKRLTGSGTDWKVRMQGIQSTGEVQKLNTNDDEYTAGDFGTFTTTNIIVNGSGSSGSADVHTNGGTYICYAWKAVDGVSAFGYYTGSGDTNHAGVDIDFFPRFVLVKGKSHSGDWLMYDAFRSGATVSGDRMSPYLTAQNTNGDGSASGDNQIELYESGGTKGFRPEQTNNGSNATGRTYIYWAFA